MELCLVVDHACNLRCRYCYTGQKRREAMSSEVMRAAVDWALSHNTGWLSVTLFGGEPLLYPHVLETAGRVVDEALAAYGRPVNLRWLLDTNATLLDETHLDWLVTHKPSMAFVSLDGIEAAHDLHRRDAAGKGTHARVLEGISRLQKRGIPFDVIAVANPDTAHWLGPSLELLLSLGAQHLQFQVNLRAAWTEANLRAFAFHAREAAMVWANAFRHGRAVAVEPFHGKVLSHLFGGLHLPSRCEIASREAAVAPSGRIYPCAEMVGEDRELDWVIGHVQTGLDAERVHRLRSMAGGVHQTCGECALNSRCLNRCGCRQIACAGTLGRVTQSLCDTESAWLEAADLAAQALVAESCDAFLNFYYGRTWLAPEPASARALVPLRVRSG